MPLKKPSQGGSGGSPATVAASSGGYLSTFVNLMEFLCSSVWEDGSRRERGSLLITVTGSQWQLKVRDPNSSRYAFYVSSSLEDALLGIDTGLETDQLDWRPEKPFPGQQKR